MRSISSYWKQASKILTDKEFFCLLLHLNKLWQTNVGFIVSLSVETITLIQSFFVFSFVLDKHLSLSLSFSISFRRLVKFYDFLSFILNWLEDYIILSDKLFMALERAFGFFSFFFLFCWWTDFKPGIRWATCLDTIKKYPKNHYVI